ncbi:hypothetical protein PBY51_003638 [Eleginops maclovinus]|uniref:Uncharacterized protein n=1 Tax=Eleginops maclovinus TaxID=56733 RepID=A0AAN7Y168_ELEMC|nr:hypothetical protein PBY51_003638 [Eleginops maclovinus]
MPHCGVYVAWELLTGSQVGTEQQEKGGGPGVGGSTVLGPLCRDSSKTCLRWPRTGLIQTGPLVAGFWRRRRQAALAPFPHWLFSPPAYLHGKVP